MTKLKNTKKGMAKKALSISLVAAMLATSNVPVWAAEDIFSDNSAAVEAEAPVEDVDVFSSEEDSAAPVTDAAVVEEAEAGIELQAASDYTVETNLELSTTNGDWSGKLALKKQTGATGNESFTIQKGNDPINPEKVEVYYNQDLVNTHKAADLSEIQNVLNGYTPGWSVYKGGKSVEVKVYVAGEKEPVAAFSYTLKPVDITGRTDITYDNTKASFPYDGQAHYPTGVVVGTTAKLSEGKIRVGYEKVTDGINVGTYQFYAEGVEEEGYIGRTALSGAKAITITPATPSEKNLSIQVSGDVTYNGTAKEPGSVVVTDKLSGKVLPKELYSVTTTNTNAGTYDAATTPSTLGVSVSMNVNNGKTGSEEVINNFASGNVTGANIITGSYRIAALDLAALASNYNVSVKSQSKNTNFTNLTEAQKKAMLVITEKDTGKDVTNDVLPSTGITYTATAAAGASTGSFVLTDANLADANIVGSLSLTFNIVDAAITSSDVFLPKGTKINGVDVCPTGKQSLATLANNQTFQGALVVNYDGTAKEPLKDVFGKLVQASADVAGDDLVYTLGTDYDIVYENNTNSDAVRTANNEGQAKVILRFKGKYTGDVAFNLTINRAPVAVTGAPIYYEAGKTSYNALVKAVTTVDGKEVVIPESNYTVRNIKPATSLVAPNNEATAEITFTNKNYFVTNATDAENLKITITSELFGKSLKDVSASIEGTYVYTGKAINPTIVVKDGANTLKEGTDYKVVSKSGTEAGDATVVIEGMGNYSGQVVLKYTIAKADIKDAVVDSGKGTGKETNYDRPYNGQVQGPAFAVDNNNKIVGIKLGDVVLSEYNESTKLGDFVVTYDENAKEIGTYNYKITAVASSTKVQGEITGTYKITPALLTAQFVRRSAPTYNPNQAGATQMGPDLSYTGKALTIEDLKTRYVLVDENSNVLKEGVDYRLEYEDNTDAGEATVFAYGLRNYAYVEDGKEIAIATANFIIEGIGTIIDSNIKAISDVEYAGGLNVEPAVTVKIGNKTLVQGVDYEVVTYLATEVGTYQAGMVGVIGKGAYTAGDNTNMYISNGSLPDWKVTKKDLKNTTISVDGDNVTVMNGTVLVPSSEYDVEFSEDGKKVTVTAKADSKSYTGSQEKDTDSKAVGTPVIAEVKVTNNKANIILSGDVDNAIGYDYVVSTVEDYKNGRVAIDKNQPATQSTIQYLQKGEYYAYLHAWKRVDGKKVFGGWSNIVKFTVTTTTPEQPVVISAVAKGSTVTVKYTKTKNATGYDIVLGTETQKVNGELRPVKYGKLVKKVYNGNTVTVTFKNVPKDTYYAGLHAYNRTSVNNSKVFSPWSNSKKVVVK